VTLSASLIAATAPRPPLRRLCSTGMCLRLHSWNRRLLRPRVHAGRMDQRCRSAADSATDVASGKIGGLIASNITCAEHVLHILCL
jgi:hypothetical protein